MGREFSVISDLLNLLADRSERKSQAHGLQEAFNQLIFPVPPDSISHGKSPSLKILEKA
jgi:hypothetical protein